MFKLQLMDSVLNFEILKWFSEKSRKCQSFLTKAILVTPCTCTYCSSIELLLYFFWVSFLQCLKGICMSRQSQIRFLSDVGIFIVHAWCVAQTRPRFNVPSERRQGSWALSQVLCGPNSGPSPPSKRPQEATYLQSPPCGLERLALTTYLGARRVLSKLPAVRGSHQLKRSLSYQESAYLVPDWE